MSPCTAELLLSTGDIMFESSDVVTVAESSVDTPSTARNGDDEMG